MPDLAVFYEHPQWFEPLFRDLDRRGVDWAPIRIQDHTFDPADPRPPAPVILSRLAMSSFLRQDEHALFYSVAALGHWEGLGARVINGARVLAYDLNKARQLSLFRQLGLEIPRTRVAHRRAGRPAPRRRARLPGAGEGQRRRLRRAASSATTARGARARGRRRPDAGRRRWRGAGAGIRAGAATPA